MSGLDFNKGKGLIPVIIQEESTNEVLMLGFMNQEAPSRKLGVEVIAAVEKRLEDLPTKETAKVALGARGAIILVRSLEEAFVISNFLAPEHLEIHIDDAISWLEYVENAGSVFLGKYAPEAAGDYASGPNHVIPTGGFAAAQSGLSVKDFIKTPTVQYLSVEGLRLIAPTIIALSEAEGLAGHAESIKVRMRC